MLSCSRIGRVEVVCGVTLAVLTLLCFAFPGALLAETSGLVAAYGFAEGSGATTADASGNGLTGTLQAATWTTSGKFGNALSFDGASGYVDMGNPTALQLTSSATWSAWILATGNPADDGQIIAKSGSGDGWQLKTTPDTGVRTFGVAVFDGTRHVQRYSNTVLSLNTWYHVAGVYNATGRTLDIYVNGVLDDGVLAGAVPASQNNSAVNVNVGRRSGGYYFIGTIDEVRVYNRALSQAEIQADMNTSLGVTDTQEPAAPSNLTASATSLSQINLSWTASTDNVAVTGYLIERCQGAGCSTFAQIAAPAGTATNYNDTGLTANTSYSYQVLATDTAGNLSLPSNVATASTPADTQAPTAPTALTATAASGTQINLSWTASTDDVAVTGYLVERCLGAACSSFAQIAAPAGTATIYSDTGLTPGSSYSYRVRATDAILNLGPYSNVATTSTPAITSSLVSAYGFAEGSGTTTADASGNGLTGTLQAATWTTSGKFGNALSFDGASGYVDMGNPTALQLTSSATWSAWILATGNPADDGQIIAKSGGRDGWQLKTTPDTGVRTFGVAVSAGTSNVQRYSKTVLSLNTWYHVAGVYNATAGTLDIYVNGVLDDGVLAGAVPASQNNSTVNVNVGRRSGGFYFLGIIDEVRVYNRALSQAEIQADMNTPVDSAGPVSEVTLSSANVVFGNQVTETTSPAQPVTLTNTGSAVLNITSIAVTGADGADFAQTNDCGDSLAPATNCTINVTFTPTAQGTRNGAVTITDNAGGSPRTVALSGNGAAAPAPLQITTSSLPGGLVQVAYSAMLAGRGGTPPYTWTVFGDLPAGLRLASSTGKISGTPTQSGPVSFNIQLTDNGGQSAAAGFSITVDPAVTSQINHVFIVVEENADYASALAGMAYLSSLATQNGLSTQYYADTHPSIGNYMMMTTGQIVTNDDSFTGTVSVDNVVRHLIAAGRTWKAYAEDLPSVGYTGGDTGNYSMHHNPLSYFSDVRGNPTQLQNLVPFSQFGTDMANGALPNYSFIAPNLCNDGHDCDIGVADSWLQTNIGPLLNDQVFQQDGLLLIAFDESESDNTLGGGRIPLVLIGPQAKKQFQSTTLYQHESLCRLSLEALGITSWPGAAAGAPSMSEFFLVPIP